MHGAYMHVCALLAHLASLECRGRHWIPSITVVYGCERHVSSGTKSVSSARSANYLNCGTISPQEVKFLKANKEEPERGKH